MPYETHHIDRWCFANIDLIGECLEKNNKAVVLIAGASSSGKSHVSQLLISELEKHNLRSTIISLDQYNYGLSGIIPNKVNENYFDGKLKNIDLIRKRIKDIIYFVDFDKKYSSEILSKIKIALSDLIDEKDMEKFLLGLSKEWGNLNFDESSVYDLKGASDDVKTLLKDKPVRVKKYSKVVSEQITNDVYINGSDYDVIIVEGIYALDDKILNELKDIDCIKNFIEGNAKSLFLRRVIRDSKETSADNIFTISSYFKYILKSYYDEILPNKKYADIIFHNEMTYSEMRDGNLYLSKFEFLTQDRESVNKLLSILDVEDRRYQKDYYLSTDGENLDTKNILRLRSISPDGTADSYKISSLVHKGIPKLRNDGKNIRPINVLLDETQIEKVWSNVKDAIKDFEYAGFKVGFVRDQVKTRAHLNNQKITIRDINSVGIKIEISTPYDESVLKKVKEILNTDFFIDYKQF